MVTGCELVWQQVSNYLDDDIDPSLRIVFDDHLRTCSDCRSVVEGTRNVIRLYGDERLFQIPLGFSGRLQRKLAVLRPSPVRTAYVWAMAAAATILVAGGVAFAGWNDGSVVARDPMAQPARQSHLPKNLVVVAVANGKLFHLSTCTFIHEKDGPARSMTAEEALREGYTPCVRCLGQYLVGVAAEFLREATSIG